MKPLVSFVIPFHIHTPILRKVVQAIREQDFNAPFEILLINDSGNEVRTFENCRVFETKKEGPAGARNKGAKEASGDYLAFVDSDVILSTDWLKTCYAEMNRLPRVAAVQAPLEIGFMQNENPGFLDRYRKEYKSFITNGTNIYGCPFPIINTAGCLIRTNAFWDVGGFRSELRRNEDTALTIDLLMKGYHLSTTANNGGYVYHDKGMLRYLVKFFRQARADKQIWTLFPWKSKGLGFRKFPSKNPSFRLFRLLCYIIYCTGSLTSRTKSLGQITASYVKTNFLISIHPFERLIFDGNRYLVFDARNFTVSDGANILKEEPDEQI